MLVLQPGVYGLNSNTHIGLCDIQMFAHIPNLIYLAPASKEEYFQMFKFATTQKKHPKNKEEYIQFFHIVKT